MILFKCLDCFIPIKFIIPSPTTNIPIIIFLVSGSAACGHTDDSVTAKKFAIVAQAIILTIHFINPTSNPTKSPNASFA